jgi:bifunctional non-homologous end joining protein LigD
MATDLVPMMATLSRLPEDEEHWGFEIKWDGVRALAHVERGKLRLTSRNLRDITGQYPELADFGGQFGNRRQVLDGELVALDDDGRSNFQRLQRRMHVASPSEAERRSRLVPVTYMVFDVLYLDGKSRMDLRYEERRAELEGLKLRGPAWQTPSYHPGEGSALLQASRERGLEGIIAKRLSSRYVPGQRTRDWLKVKNVQRQEVVIGGWVPGEGRREGELGALLIGYYDGDDLKYAGKVGTGFDAAALAMLRKRLEPLATSKSPFTGRQPERDARFVKPRLVCEVDFSEWTQAGTLRHPSYQGLRADKKPKDVVRERPVEPPS